MMHTIIIVISETSLQRNFSICTLWILKLFQPVSELEKNTFYWKNQSVKFLLFFLLEKLENV